MKTSSFVVCAIFSAALAFCSPKNDGASLEPNKSPSLDVQTKTLQPSIVGSWLYVGYRYKDQLFPPRDSRLEMVFTFRADGSSNWQWTYNNGSTFCEHEGTYTFIDGELQETVVWVNPKNAPSCGEDPDMQVGRRAQNPAQIVVENGNPILEIDIPLGSETLTYRLVRLSQFR